MRALVLAYVALLPYQLEVGDRLNFAPADLLLLLALLFAPGALKYRGPAWSAWHLSIAMTVCAGALVSALRFGVIQRYELVNKCAGLFLPLLSYAVITSHVASWSDLRQVLRVFVYGVVFENAIAVSGFLTSYFYGISNPFTRYGYRLSGTLLDPNAYGGLLVVALVICEGASYGPAPLIGCPQIWIARLTLGLGILFTFSRSAWVAFGFALLVLCVVRTRMAVRLILAGMTAAPCLFFLMGPRFLPVFETMASRPKQVQGRFDLIHSALTAFTAHPLFGGGIGSFRLGEGEIAHNTAMWFLADFGIIGLFALLGFLSWFFVKAWHAYRFAPSAEQPVVLGLLLAHAAMVGLAMGIEAFYQRPWWTVFALIASGYCLTQRRSAGPLQVLRGCHVHRIH
jgi:hypothetical protein